MKPDTLTTHAGRDPGRFDGMVNTPVFRASTVLFPNVAAYESRDPNNYKVTKRRLQSLKAAMQRWRCLPVWQRSLRRSRRS
jgi:cystathionine beta-lyase/cystathionine gamma-synthase